ncbi:MAG TPA: YdeI/OmpD-associated family protein, partial [Chitinophagaceae bacterium]|nr:YdeI/OmpD-associated family protein [Chitinophagaceae bacterium]
RSIWSKLNVERAKKLIETGRMKPAGIKHIEAAKADGRWQAAYDSPANTELPEDFLTLLSKKPKAKKFFDTLNKTNRFAINWRLQTAKKPETRARRMMAIIEMLASGKKFH